MRRHRLGDDRGLALVELVLVLPVLSLLVFGTIELGMAWVADHRVEAAVSHAARVGAAGGSREEADRDVLVALRAGLPPAQLAAVDRVVVFRPANEHGAVPPGCIREADDDAEVGTSSCNSYSGATLRSVSAASMAGFGATSGAKDRFWPPAVRSDSLSGPPDHLGVWVRTKHRSITGFGFAAITIATSSVYRIQPDLAG